MNTDVQCIKEKLPFLDFIRSYITLIPAGKNFKALCPFHGERTPSFIVSPERQLWHCFGACGEGGDMIKFVMKYENLDFPEALRFLAERAGIKLSRDASSRSDLDALYGAYEVAKDYYAQCLAKNEEASAYLKERGLALDVIAEFEVGFAPYGDGLTTHLIKQGFAVSDIMRAGLASKSSTGLWRDKFQERIVFPIQNSVSRTVAFTGRLLPRVQKARERDPRLAELPKYLNSAESPIFNKSKLLYVFHKTKSEILHARAAFIVEGQMDALMSYQAGVKNVVAVSGTGFTEDHGQTLRRIADTLIVSFDADAAGQDALERTLPIFLKFDFHITAIELLAHKDPADMALADPRGFLLAVKSARPVFEHIISSRLKSLSSNSLVERRRLVRSLLSLIALVRSSVERDEYVGVLSRGIGVSPQSLLQELSTLVRSTAPMVRSNVQPVSRESADRASVLSRRVLEIGFTSDEILGIVKANVDLLSASYRELVLLGDDDERVKLLRIQAESFNTADSVTLRRELDELILRLQVEREKANRLDLQRKMRSSQGIDFVERERVLLEVQRVTQRISELEKNLDEHTNIIVSSGKG